MLLAVLQFADRVAQHGVLREVAGDGLLHLPHFARAEGVVLQHGLFQIELDGLRHRGLLLITCRRRLPSPILAKFAQAAWSKTAESATGVASYKSLGK